MPPTGNICKAFIASEKTKPYTTLASTFPEGGRNRRMDVWGKGL